LKAVQARYISDNYVSDYFQAVHLISYNNTAVCKSYQFLTLCVMRCSPLQTKPATYWN